MVFSSKIKVEPLPPDELEELELLEELLDELLEELLELEEELLPVASVKLRVNCGQPFTILICSMSRREGQPLPVLPS